MPQKFVVHAVVLLLATIACADDLPIDLPGEGGAMVDRGHASVSRGVTDMASSIDAFFASDVYEESLNVTRFRVGLGFRVAEYDGVEPLARLRVNLSLPYTARRFNVVISSLSDDDEIDARVAHSDEDNDVAGFLRFFLIEGDPLQIVLDGGTRLRPEPDPFVRARVRREVPLGAHNLLRPTQFFFWELQEGLGTRTRVDFDRQLNHKTLLRLRGQATMTESSDGVELEPAALMFRNLNRRSWLRLELSLDYDTDPPRVVDRYTAGLSYRRAVWRNWLFVEVEPYFRFEQEHDYGPSPGVDVRVETLIGGDYGRLPSP